MKKQQITQIMAFLFFIGIVVFGVLWNLSKEEIVARELGNNIVDVKVDDQVFNGSAFIPDGDSSCIELKSEQDQWMLLQIGTAYAIEVLENGQESSLVNLSEDDFEIQNEIEELNQTDDTNELKNLAFEVEENANRVIYIRLMANESFKLKVMREESAEQPVTLQSLTNPQSTDTLLIFQKLDHFFNWKDGLIIDSDEVNDLALEENDTEFSSDNLEDMSRINRDTSGTNPFKVNVDVTRTVGVAPFDTSDAPGYASSSSGNRLRTFDSASYTVIAGIEVNNPSYKSLRVRLDTTIDDAWRKDTSGQLRQTVEIQNGTLMTADDGTKTANHSSWLTVDGGTAQIFLLKQLIPMLV